MIAWVIRLNNILFDLVNHDEAVQTAQRHGSGHADLFSSALGYLGTNKVMDLSCGLRAMGADF